MLKLIMPLMYWLAGLPLLVYVWYHNPAFLSGVVDFNLEVIKLTGNIPEWGAYFESALRALFAEKALLFVESNLTLRAMVLVVKGFWYSITDKRK